MGGPSVEATLKKTLTSELPIYLRIAQAISGRRKDISQAIKLASEEELARQHHVTRTTLRRAMEHLEKQGAVSRRPGYGTFLHPLSFSSPVASGSTVGFMCPWWVQSINAWYAATVFDGVHKWAEARDCQVNVLFSGRFGDGAESLLEKVANRKLSGLLWVHPVREQMKILNAVSKQIPCVVVGRDSNCEEIRSVTPDYEQVARLLHDHLVSKGHTRYAVLSKNLADSHAACWYNAIQQVHEKNGLIFDSLEYFIDVGPFPRDRLADLLLDFYLPAHPEVTAFVLTSSTFLTPLLANEKFRKQIGEEISLATHDYGMQAMHTYQPGMNFTHVTCDWPNIGAKAMGLLFSILQGHPVPKVIREPVRLIDHNTVKDIRN